MCIYPPHFYACILAVCRIRRRRYLQASVEDQSHTSMSAADELLDRPEATLALLNISEPATEPPAGPVFPTLEPYPWSEPPISPSEVPAGLTRVAIPHPDLRLVDFEAQRESQEYINMLLDREEPGKKKATELRKKGEEVIRRLVRSSSGKDVTPYFHSLVCAIPRQSKTVSLFFVSMGVMIADRNNPTELRISTCCNDYNYTNTHHTHLSNCSSS